MGSRVALYLIAIFADTNDIETGEFCGEITGTLALSLDQGEQRRSYGLFSLRRDSGEKRVRPGESRPVQGRTGVCNHESLPVLERSPDGLPEPPYP
jgi:hypothetical protein